jgi:hypothetical protein
MPLNEQNNEVQQDAAQVGSPDPVTATDSSVAAQADGASTDHGDGDLPKDGEDKPAAARGRGSRAAKNDPEPDVLIGTIRIHEGKEYVKAAPGDWRPVIRLDGDIPPPDDGERVKIRNEKMSGQKIFLGDGEIAEFDQDGIIEVGGREAARLAEIPGYERAC